jgi:glutathionylspermidine synthase
MNPEKEPNMLFTYMDSQEDKANMEFMAKAAVEAGFAVEFRELPEITFSDDKEEGGVWVDYGEDRFQRFDFWFKLIPWEFLAVDEPGLIETLTKITKDENCVILNPAYTMLFQSKMIMKVLWDLYPNHPLLLKTVDSPLTNEKHVKKVIFGREGANVSIIDSDGSEIETKDGDYGSNPSVYQEYAELPTDIYGSSYQAGVFYIGGSAGLGYRRGTKIMNDTAEFVSHYIQE